MVPLRSFAEAGLHSKGRIGIRFKRRARVERTPPLRWRRWWMWPEGGGQEGAAWWVCVRLGGKDVLSARSLEDGGEGCRMSDWTLGMSSRF